MFFTLPAALALMMISGPIIYALFERGAFVRSDSIGTASALTAFAAGLPALVRSGFRPGFLRARGYGNPHAVRDHQRRGEHYRRAHPF